MDDLPITDAHQHFWDLGRVRYPWLMDRPMVGFRYGDYSAIKQDYLPADYFADTARQNVVRTVHLEAESDPIDPVAETRWLHQLAQRVGQGHDQRVLDGVGAALVAKKRNDVVLKNPQHVNLLENKAPLNTAPVKIS